MDCATFWAIMGDWATFWAIKKTQSGHPGYEPYFFHLLHRITMENKVEKKRG
jgi:hypothetical protein